MYSSFRSSIFQCSRSIVDVASLNSETRYVRLRRHHDMPQKLRHSASQVSAFSPASDFRYVHAETSIQTSKHALNYTRVNFISPMNRRSRWVGCLLHQRPGCVACLSTFPLACDAVNNSASSRLSNRRLFAVANYSADLTPGTPPPPFQVHASFVPLASILVLYTNG